MSGAPRPAEPAPVPAVEVCGVSHRYAARSGSSDALEVLREIDFTAAPGEFVSIVGPSGCGKSTLLGLMAGFIPLQQGRMRVGGAPGGTAGAHCVLIAQEDGLFGWKTAAGNVEFGLKARGVPRAERARAARAALRVVGLDGFADLYPHQLSGGMKQRATLARALVVRPAVLLLDEPFAALDGYTRHEMQGELMRVLADRRSTVVLVTHDLDEALFVADRVLVLGRRPATVLDVVPVDLPRPRLPEHRLGTALLMLKRRIWKMLHPGSTPAAERRGPTLPPPHHRSEHHPQWSGS